MQRKQLAIPRTTAHTSVLYSVMNELTAKKVGSVDGTLETYEYFSHLFFIIWTTLFKPRCLIAEQAACSLLRLRRTRMFIRARVLECIRDVKVKINQRACFDRTT